MKIGSVKHMKILTYERVKWRLEIGNPRKNMRKKPVKMGNSPQSSSKVSLNIGEFSIVRLRSIKTIKESLYLKYLQVEYQHLAQYHPKHLRWV